LFDELFAILEAVDKQYNSYSEGSYFDLINKYAGQFVEVDQETIAILNQITFLSSLFDGEYDITVMPLIRLWGFYKNEQLRVPTPHEIDCAKRSVDYRSIEIQDSRVRIAKGQEIITGSFIKSYAVDKLVRKMQYLGITDAIINAGGSTIKAINDTIHTHWQVDVIDTQDKAKHLFKLQLSNTCFSTSAQTNTFVDIDGKQYGHIINPLTGYPSPNKQIGIISDSCFLGDVISTGLYNQTLDGFLAKMKILSNQFKVSGFLMDENNEIRISANFEQNIIR
jgi:thiamine biosynthesis lipoprotein